MMCEGVSPASWMMCSARSVSTRSIPASARACGRPISSPSIDFTRVHALGLRSATELDRRSGRPRRRSQPSAPALPAAIALRSNSIR